MRSSHSPSALSVTFDDTHAVAHAGLALVGTLSERLGVEAVVDERVDLSGCLGHHRPGRKVATLVHAMVAGADCIDDADLLRSGATGAVLAHGDGTLHGWDLPALAHLRPRPPARAVGRTTGGTNDRVPPTLIPRAP